MRRSRAPGPGDLQHCGHLPHAVSPSEPSAPTGTELRVTVHPDGAALPARQRDGSLPPAREVILRQRPRTSLQNGVAVARRRSHKRSGRASWRFRAGGPTVSGAGVRIQPPLVHRQHLGHPAGKAELQPLTSPPRWRDTHPRWRLSPTRLPLQIRTRRNLHTVTADDEAAIPRIGIQIGCRPIMCPLRHLFLVLDRFAWPELTLP